MLIQESEVSVSSPDEESGPNPDCLSLLTVGIDIGTSTSHLMISRLVMRRLGKHMQSRWIVAERRIVYRSRVLLTPYRQDSSIDAVALEDFFAAAFREAGLAPETIDTGAVLLTGEAVRRRNARAIADLFASTSGRFVCTAAGHYLEALVAGYGSGALRLAQQTGEVILNVDIGGGTSKFALVHGGAISAAAAVNVGGRLVALDDERRVIRIEPAAQTVAKVLGIPLHMGDRLAVEDEEQIVDLMAECIADAMAPSPRLGLTRQLMLTELMPACTPTRITVSGGVAEYLRDPGSATFGDLAPRLAVRARERLAEISGVRVEAAAEQLRATAVGLSQFAVQVSGDTIFVGQQSPLPLRNLPVITATIRADPVAAEVADQIGLAVRRREIHPADQPLALALHWQGRPAFGALRELALGISQSMAPAVGSKFPVVVCVSQDCARGLGHLLARELPSSQVVCVDGLDLEDFDFIDIGAPVPGRPVLPVVVKSLVFPAPDPVAG